MFCVQETFVQATFSVTSILSRLLIHPLSPSLPTPSQESWKAVNDRILAQVPSTILLEMAVKELERELNGLGLKSVGGWIFSNEQTVDISQLLERYSRRYYSLTCGIISEELKRALDKLFSEDPRFQARLSVCDDKESAIEEVARRVLSQLRFTWEVDRLRICDTSALGIRLLVEFQDVLYRRLNESVRDAYLMPATRFKRYEHFLRKMQQFRGLDSRFDLVLADYGEALSLFPEDGRSLFGTHLEEFRSQLKALAKYISDELQKDFFEDSILCDEESNNLDWAIEDALLEDVCEQLESQPTNQQSLPTEKLPTSIETLEHAKPVQLTLGF